MYIEYIRIMACDAIRTVCVKKKWNVLKKLNVKWTKYVKGISLFVLYIFSEEIEKSEKQMRLKS